jgi:peptidoglycan/xylan/chitin deacetylase (PgdA/CDA1 family)
MALLTIDDAPSSRFEEKLAYLKRRGIPAVLFCVGRDAEGREAALADALASGYLVGNHSYSHPHFSEISIERCREEIERTDALLSRVYDIAALPWERKFFRFPYLDRGGDRRRQSAIQDILLGLGYRALQAGPWGPADTGCDFDQMEYWLGKAEAPEGLAAADAILARIGRGRPREDDVILIHDHENTHELFFRCLERYQDHGVVLSRPGRPPV